VLGKGKKFGCFRSRKLEKHARGNFRGDEVFERGPAAQSNENERDSAENYGTAVGTAVKVREQSHPHKYTLFSRGRGL